MVWTPISWTKRNGFFGVRIKLWWKSAIILWQKRWSYYKLYVDKVLERTKENELKKIGLNVKDNLGLNVYTWILNYFGKELNKDAKRVLSQLDK